MSEELPQPPVLVEARNVRKTYELDHRPVEVLRGVNLTVANGQLVALRGASGAGKTTLLNLLGGLDAPTAGEIWFAGQSLGGFSESQMARFRNTSVGFIFQAYHLLPELDALENVCLPARMARVPAAEAQQRGRELLAEVGLGHRLEHQPSELSGGEQQRVALARALINRPPLLLADEPTGNLDSRTGEQIIDLLLALRAERHATLIIATHDTQIACRAPRILDLVDGVIRPEA
jgi:predicted ABC-type transport system involved in lysophospholipase L1 biosynthesis ATPase subunit